MSLLGELLLRLYHRPAGRMRRLLRNGGPIAERKTERQRREMVAAAGLLPELPQFSGTPPVTLHLLTGRQFWYQTLFCLHSFARAAQTSLRSDSGPQA